MKPDSQKLFSYELRCSSTYSNHFFGLEIDMNVHTQPFLVHNKTKRVTRFFEKSVRDIILESESKAYNVGSRIILENFASLSQLGTDMCVFQLCMCF